MPLFGKKKSSKDLGRIFYATDLHGSERTYRKFINAGKFYEVKTLIMGGDVIGKMAIPIIKTGSGYRATLQGTTEHMETEEELTQLRRRIETLGFYHKVMSEDEFLAVQADPAAIETMFHDLARARLEDWVNLAEERLKGTGIKCFITGGNDDYQDVLDVIPHVGGSTETIFNCEGDVVYIDDNHTMISLGWSTPTPWDTPREMPDEELGKLIEEMVSQVPDLSRNIFNFHDPPIDSTLDTCPMLDWDKDPPEIIFQAGTPVLHGAGSKSIRAAIEKHQPLLGLHGHIHESAGVVKIGRTTCINPGSEYGEGILKGCIVTYDDDKVAGFQITSG